MPSGKTTIFRKFRKNRKNGHFLQSLTLKMVGLLQLKLPTSTLVGFLINGLIMNILQHIFPQAENLVFQFQKSRGRIFCVFPRLLLLQSKSLRPLLAGEFVGRSSETQREMRKQWNLSDAANGPTQTRNHPQNKKNDQKTGRRRILKMVQVRRSWTNFSPPLKNANFPTPSRWGCPPSRKFLREIRKNSHNFKIGFVYRKKRSQKDSNLRPLLAA